MRNPTTWIQTFTGRKFWPLDPHPEDVCIEDIAHALSLVCRYTGHVRQFYSVAQHSVHVAELLKIYTPQVQLAGLLHDASEAYIADIARPVKHQLTQYLEIEFKLECCLAGVFGIQFPYPAVVKDADNVMLDAERRDLMPPMEFNRHGSYIREAKIECLSPAHAEEEFLELYQSLRAKCGDT